MSRDRRREKGLIFVYEDESTWPMPATYIVNVCPDTDIHYIAQWDGISWTQMGYDYDHWACEPKSPRIRMLYRIQTSNGCRLRKLRTKEDLHHVES